MSILGVGALSQQVGWWLAERGEQRIQRQQDIMTAIAAKMERYKNPWQELKLQYGANKGKAYTGAPHIPLVPVFLCWSEAMSIVQRENLQARLISYPLCY